MLDSSRGLSFAPSTASPQALGLADRPGRAALPRCRPRRRPARSPHPGGRAALDERAHQRSLTYTAASAAAAHAKVNNVGANMTLSTGLFEPATSWMVPNHMAGVACAQRDQADKIRASDERNEVNSRVFECADLQDLREAHASTRSGTGSGCA